MSVYSFGHEANPVHGLDSDVNALGSSLNQVTLDTVQGTALYDSVIQASSELANAPTLTKVLVVLTDGDDTTKTKLGAAVKAARAGNVTIDAIAIGSGNHAALTSLARQTGGHVFAADRSAAGIAAVYRQIAAEIRNTYRLQYTLARRRPRAASGQPQGLHLGDAEDRPDRSRGADRRSRRHHREVQQAQLVRAGARTRDRPGRARPGAAARARAARDAARSPARPLHDGRARGAGGARARPLAAQPPDPAR